MNEAFHFKQFTVQQDRCAMKIGTDGVLLGAWTSLEGNPESILDIGAGTGIIALMLAQRSKAETIDAIELDEGAYEQCVENFETSDWANRLFCYHVGLDEFTDEIEEKYDLIVSNPPFYEPALTPPKGVNAIADSRKRARFYDSLPFDELLEGVSKLLSSDGHFALVIPYKEETALAELAGTFGLFLNRILRVKGNLSAEIKRSLLEFSFKEKEISSDQLTVELERHKYTKNYIELTKDFYLKM